MTLSEEFRRL